MNITRNEGQDRQYFENNDPPRPLLTNNFSHEILNAYMYHPHALINKGMGLVQWPSRRAWWADVDVMAKGTSGTSLGPPAMKAPFASNGLKADMRK